MTEREYWHQLITELQGVMTVAKIAQGLGTTGRQVWRWKAGDRPRGIMALKIAEFHMKHCQSGQGQTGQLSSSSGSG